MLKSTWLELSVTKRSPICCILTFVQYQVGNVSGIRKTQSFFSPCRAFHAIKLLIHWRYNIGTRNFDEVALPSKENANVECLWDIAGKGSNVHWRCHNIGERNGALRVPYSVIDKVAFAINVDIIIQYVFFKKNYFHW